MLIDSHCHLDYEPINKDLDNILKKAKKAGINYLLTICTEDKSFNKILHILKKYNNVFGTYGVHPHEAKFYDNLTVEKIIKNLTLDKKVIGIGETGLDFFL